MGVGASKEPVLTFEKCETDIFIPHKKYRPFPFELRSRRRTICTKFRPTPPQKDLRSHLETGALNKRERSTNFDRYRGSFCAVSPNGAYLALICDPGVHFWIVVVEKPSRKFRVVGRVRRHEINRGCCNCKWSPDSQFIAFTSIDDNISLVDCRDKKRPALYLNVVDDFEKFDGRIANPRAFDFDPKSAHSVLAFATRGDVSKLHVYDVDEKAVVRSTVLTADEYVDEEEVELSKYGLSISLRYSHSGYVIAVTLGLRIQILNASDLYPGRYRAG
ncbi:uncharacterized protein LOC141911235 [Tubulanus polymorphus]|uniref:uncharacterized protein LOC141911235 n=1 Tax=Tubulanus polymorphus TaxID=672921 RepID=UPI003DA4122F